MLGWFYLHHLAMRFYLDLLRQIQKTSGINTHIDNIIEGQKDTPYSETITQARVKTIYRETTLRLCNAKQEGINILSRRNTEQVNTISQ